MLDSPKIDPSPMSYFTEIWEIVFVQTEEKQIKAKAAWDVMTVFLSSFRRVTGQFARFVLTRAVTRRRKLD